jgi:hypothetical protein
MGAVRRAVVVAVLSSAVSAPEGAVGHGASVVVMPGVPVAGRTAELAGTGFGPRSAVAVRLGSSRITGVRADGRGAVSASVPIPASWRAGERRLVVSARGRKVQGPVRVARRDESPASALAVLADRERFMVGTTRGRVGARVRIRGSALGVHRRLTVTLGGIRVGSARSNTRRRLDLTIKVPALSVAAHTLTLRWRGERVRVGFTGLADPPPPSQPPTPPPPAPPPPAPPPVVAAAGDIACQAGDPVTATTCHHAATAEVIASLAPSAVLPLGDNQYGNGTLAEFAASYGPTWGRFNAIAHPVPGDEEYGTTGASGYFAYFGALAGDPAAGYYSFNLGSWHIIALNSLCTGSNPAPCAATSAQTRWLRADLAANPRACTLAYWHKPRFTSAGAPGQASETGPFWDALYAAGADVVLGGNAHNYERFAPQTPGRVRDDQHGIRQFVVGTGGKSHAPFLTGQDLPRPNSEVRSADTFGVLALTLNPTSYSWRFAPEAGASFTDAGSELCR